MTVSVAGSIGIIWPGVTATLFRNIVPLAGSVVSFTPMKPLAGLSLGSLKPKSAGESVRVMSSLVVRWAVVPSGASFTLVTLNVIELGVTDKLLLAALSSTWK